MSQQATFSGMLVQPGIRYRVRIWLAVKIWVNLIGPYFSYLPHCRDDRRSHSCNVLCLTTSFYDHLSGTIKNLLRETHLDHGFTSAVIVYLLLMI